MDLQTSALSLTFKFFSNSLGSCSKFGRLQIGQFSDVRQLLRIESLDYFFFRRVLFLVSIKLPRHPRPQLILRSKIGRTLAKSSSKDEKS